MIGSALSVQDIVNSIRVHMNFKDFITSKLRGNDWGGKEAYRVVFRVHSSETAFIQFGFEVLDNNSEPTDSYLWFPSCTSDDVQDMMVNHTLLRFGCTKIVGVLGYSGLVINLENATTADGTNYCSFVLKTDYDQLVRKNLDFAPAREVLARRYDLLNSKLQEISNIKHKLEHKEQKPVSQGVLALLNKAAGSVNTQEKEDVTVSISQKETHAVPTRTVKITLQWDCWDADERFVTPDDVDDLPIAVYKGCPEKVNETWDFPGTPLMQSREGKQWQTVIYVPISNPVLYLSECVHDYAGSNDVIYSVKGESDEVKTDVVPFTVHDDNAELLITYCWGGHDCDIPHFVIDSCKGVNIDRNARL